jgi:uncharacterized protein YaaN involved in tellurite resistance
MSDLTDRLNAIKALALRDLDNTSDEQIRAEFIEDKQYPSEVAHKVAASLARVIERTAGNQHAMTAIDAQRVEIDRLTAELAQAMKERSRAITVGSDMEQEVERLREQLALAESVRAAQVAGLTEGAERLRERVKALEDALQTALKWAPALTPDEYAKCHAALKGEA